MSEYYFAIIGVAIIGGAICKYFKINAALPLIGAGLVLEFVLPGLLQALPDPEVILTLVLAPLVFAAGLASSAIDLRKVRRSVLILAVGLVVVTTFVIGFIASAAVGVLTLASACALGSILAPTDAVAASSVAKRSGLPRRVVLIIEGESLANDGTALTILRVATLAAVAGTVTVAQTSEILVAAVVGGIAVGLLGGYLVSLAIRWIPEPMVANALLLLTPFVLYQVSEHIGGSGLLTLVIAGVWISHTTAIRARVQTRLQMTTIWNLIIFVLESFAFVLVGAELLDTLNRVTDPSLPVLVLATVLITLLILAVRALFMAGWLYLGPKVKPSSFTDRRNRAKEFVAIGLLGVRGPVSVLAAFSLPLTTDSGSPFPGRDLILCLTFGVVVLSLLAGICAGPILRRLNFRTETDAELVAQARTKMARAALARLDAIVVQADETGRHLDSTVVDELRQVTLRRVDQFTSSEQSQESFRQLMTRQQIRGEMIEAERDELLGMVRDRMLPGDISRELRRELDLREQALGQYRRGEKD